MLRERGPQRNRSTLIKKDVHLRGSEGAPRGMFQNRMDLFKRDPGEPLDELGYERPVFKVLE